jgi:hypothetical protein
MAGEPVNQAMGWSFVANTRDLVGGTTTNAGFRGPNHKAYIILHSVRVFEVGSLGPWMIKLGSLP